MPRVKNGVAHHARKKKIMEAAKGARGGRSKLYKAAKETAERAMRYAYRDRRKKKSEFRALWITRINAAARSQGMSYSRFMAGLRKAGVDVNRKVLADLAVHDSEAFARIAELARVQGVIRLMATINEAGVVEKVQVVRPSALLNAPAIESVRQWQFDPFQLNGLPVRVTTEIEVLIPRASLKGPAADDYDRLNSLQHGLTFSDR